MSESKLKQAANTGEITTGTSGLNLGKYRKFLPAVVVIIILLGGGVGWYLYNRAPSQAEITTTIHKGDFKKAEDQLKRAISRAGSKKEKADLYMDLGVVYDSTKRPQQAIDAYKQAAAAIGMTAELARTIASTYYFSGNNTQAIVYYQKAIDLWPKNSPLYSTEVRALQQTIQDLQKK